MVLPPVPNPVVQTNVVVQTGPLVDRPPPSEVSENGVIYHATDGGGDSILIAHDDPSGNEWQTFGGGAEGPTGPTGAAGLTTVFKFAGGFNYGSGSPGVRGFLADVDTVTLAPLPGPNYPAPFNSTGSQILFACARNGIPDNGSPVLVRLAVNGVGTSIVATLPPGTAAGTVVSAFGSVSIAAGDLVDVRVEADAAVSVADVIVSATLILPP
jgi:hypothetical protein